MSKYANHLVSHLSPSPRLPENGVFKVPAVPDRKRSGVRVDLAKVWKSAKRRWQELMRQVVGAAVARARGEDTRVVTTSHVLSALKAKQEQLEDPLHVWTKK